MQSEEQPYKRAVTLQPLPRPRWHRVYLLLAAFDIVTVIFSLIVSNQIVQIYRQSVSDNLSWVKHLQTVNNLSEQAAALNAPGNDVFENGNIDGEARKVHEEQQAIESRINAFRAALPSDRVATPIKDILHQLTIVEQSITSMTKEAETVFQQLRKNQRDSATRHMAIMDRYHTSVNRGLDRIRDEIGVIQRNLFHQQTEQAAWLQRLEYLIGGLILIMVAGAMFYGQRIRRLAEWHQAQEESIRASEQRATLLKQVMLAHEDERRRLARELHDGVGQSLTSLLVGLRTLEESSGENKPGQDAANLRRITSATLDEVRQLARGLRPAVLDDLGLSAALERLVAETSQIHGINVDLQLSGMDGPRLDTSIETTLYRIIQEALTNVVKHADAQWVILKVERRGNQVIVTLTDDGKGFDPELAQQGDAFGLVSMQERAAQIGGSLSIQSEPGQGTVIVVTLPVPEDHHG